MKILTIGTAILALLSLLMLAFLNSAMVFGVFYMITDASALGTFPTLFFTVPLAIIGIAATLFAIAAAFLQLRRARPKLIRFSGLSAATFYCALFCFFWVSFMIIESNDILSADDLAEQRLVVSQTLLLSLLWVAGLMVFPAARNWLGARYARSQSV